MQSSTLQTKRLKLRWFTPGDAELLLAIWNDPAFIRNVGDRGIRTVEQAREALAAGHMKLYADHGYGPYRVALAKTDEPVGLCGLFKREFLEDPDIGFAILPDHTGKGFAHEAAIAVMDYARHELGLTRMTAIVSPKNTASISLIEKLGLRYESTMTMPQEEKPVRLYVIDWDATI